MPTKHNNQKYDKSHWRDRNFDEVKRLLYSKRLHPGRLVGWLETFGRSGGESRRAALEAGVIADESQFYGVERDADIVLDHYMEKGLVRPLKGLWLGDVYTLASQLSKTETIGVYNFDMLGLAGEGRYWEQGQMKCIVEAVHNTLEKIPACFLIINHSAQTPAHDQRPIAGVIRKQRDHVHHLISELKGVGVPEGYTPPGDFSDVYLREEYEKVRLDPKKEKCFRLGGRSYEVYQSRGRYIPMLTVRLCQIGRAHV